MSNAQSPTALATTLRAERRQRWQAGQFVPAETYLQAHPELLADPEAVLDLVFHEFLLREQRGERPELEQFVARFPSWADALRQQIELHLALASADAGASFATAAGAADLTPATGVAVTPPADFGRYQILEPLDRGGMGAVYRPHDRVLDRQVALKVVHLPGGNDGRAARRFFREARAAAGLAHPHLCPVYDVGEHAGRPYLTMPLLQGRALAAWITEAGPLPEATAARVAAQTARALAAAHAAGVLHRDLKPSNIMVNERQEPVVIDFSLALRGTADEARLTPADAVVGTPAYLAPELLAPGAGPADPRTDIYGLGVVLYEMLTGQPRFQGSLYEVLRQVAEQAPAPPSRRRPGLSPDLDAICLKAMSKDPAARYASMEEFAAALEGCLRHNAHGKSTYTRVSGSRHRSKAVVAAVGLAVLLGLLALLHHLTGAVPPVAGDAVRQGASADLVSSELAKAAPVTKSAGPAAPALVEPATMVAPAVMVNPAEFRTPP